jgi:NADH:ubiquinone oxidoreductase subunit 5 (subunit L)/multisubunit Na+/H+ antiporter MnhA subunit
MGWILSQGDLNFIFYKIPREELFVVAVFVVLAAITKRAQIPFSA